MITVDRISTFKTFCEACERGGITEAAKALGLTPVTTQKRVKLLEDTYRAKLMKLTGGKNTWTMELTPAGKTMYALARGIVDASEMLTRSMEKFGDDGDFTKSPCREPEARA